MDTGAQIDDYLNNPDPSKPQLSEPSPLTNGHGDPAAQAPVVAPKQPPSQNEAVDQLYNDLYQHTAKTNPQVLTPDGSNPNDAINESPMSIMERAYLGWVRGPEQEKYLKTLYKDVQLARTPEGGANWVVKTDDGKWRQVDPNMHWETDSGDVGHVVGGALGSAAGPVGRAIGSMIGGGGKENKNTKAALGSLAQLTGEYGLRATTSALAGAAAVPYGAAAGSAVGPIGTVIGGAAAGLAAAGVAAAGTEAADLSSRQLLPDGTPGKTPYKNPAELSQQMLASALFGMENLSTGMALEGAGATITKRLGKVLSGLAGSPEGRATASKLMGGMGATPGLTEARMMNPERTATFDDMAFRDAHTPLGDENKFNGRLDKVEDTTFSSDNPETPGLLEQMQGALKREQGEFAKLQANPKVQSLQLDNAQITQDPLNYLKQKQLVTANGRMIPKEQGGVYGEGDEGAITYLRALANKPDTNQMTYQQVRQEVSKIGVLLNGKIQNNELRALLTQTKNGLNSSIIKGLGEDLGGQYKATLAKYGPVRDTLESLSNVTDKVQKKASFINSLVNTDKRNVNKSLVAGIQQAGVPFDNVEKLLQIQAAREAEPLFGKGFITKRLPINGNKFAAKLVNAHDAVMQFGRGAAESTGISPQASQEIAGTLPYTDKTLKFLRGLPSDQFKQIMANPALFDAVTKTAAGGYVGQKDEQRQLLQQAGIGQ